MCFRARRTCWGSRKNGVGQVPQPNDPARCYLGGVALRSLILPTKLLLMSYAWYTAPSFVVIKRVPSRTSDLATGIDFLSAVTSDCIEPENSVTRRLASTASRPSSFAIYCLTVPPCLSVSNMFTVWPRSGTIATCCELANWIKVDNPNPADRNTTTPNRRLCACISLILPNVYQSSDVTQNLLLEFENDAILYHAHSNEGAYIILVPL